MRFTIVSSSCGFSLFNRLQTSHDHSNECILIMKNPQDIIIRGTFSQSSKFVLIFHLKSVCLSGLQLDASLSTREPHFNEIQLNS